MNFALLKIVASAALGTIPTGADAAFPQWDGPDSTIVHVQAVLYSSLAISLLAALIAMLGQQWLNHYAQVEIHGSVVDRSRHRQHKMDGMVTWRFDFVMGFLPLMLQVALLLLGYALSNYLFFIKKVVAGIVIGFTAFGLLFYFIVASAAALSYNCPFQIPLSHILRSLIHKKYLKQVGKWFRQMFTRKNKLLRRGSGVLGALGRFNTIYEDNPGNHIELLMAGSPDQLPPLFNKEPDWDGYVLDSKCIAWMFKMSINPDTIMAIMKFIPEIVWHTGIQTTPLERLYVLGFCLYPINPGRFSNQYRTGADRCTPKLPR